MTSMQVVLLEVILRTAMLLVHQLDAWNSLKLLVGSAVSIIGGQQSTQFPTKKVLRNISLFLPFCIKSGSQIRSPLRSYSDRIRPSDSAGFGRIWSDLVGFSRIWSDLVGFGRIRSNLVGFSRIWSDSVGFGRIRSDLVECWFLVNLAGICQNWSDSVGFG